MIADTTIAETFDWAQAELSREPATAGSILLRLNAALCEIRRHLQPDAWRVFIGHCRQHPICQILLEDPLTRRSFTKPRGYPGDAELLDIIYARDWRGAYNEAPTPTGAAIFRHTIDCVAPAAVRYRRTLLARMIDQQGDECPGLSILSVACGHLRELEFATALGAGRIGRFVGLDQDKDSLAVVRRHWPQVETVAGTVKALWSPAFREPAFDFIYTAGLYDYLDDAFAARLTKRMFEMLRPGGRLLVANYHPSVPDVGYMETFMDWRLIYRDHPAMERIAAAVPAGLIDRERIFPDPTGAVLYLELGRRP